MTHVLAPAYIGSSHCVGWLLLFSHAWHLSCCCSLFWLVFLHSRLVSCNGSSHGVGWLLLFSHAWHLSCCCSLFWLMFLHSRLLSCCCPLFWLVFLHRLVCVCTASSYSVGWLLQPPLYRIGTPLRLMKSLGLFLCWCTIGMRFHLIIYVMLHNNSLSDE